ncbi:sigma factor-like helix-turn-helix DNA-binding protein [Actinopolyspora mortivallis]|uniref:RNA polymerase sigma factor SigJ n=1 Tax=Actinopolyspora mortivallis TaxID=33906 RepID=A0A2T0GYK5_ACTMO|nr:sigma factor-like helix-turn-helix DNA-binding protein [Actinopolyspora mortivallis]PRW64113.1 RNA polymerase sigma factor SigJ [Actinopolyspora mortivallis]
MRSAEDVLATEFDEQRARLFGLAYRLTGSISDSEDVVEETRTRLTGLSGTEDPGGDRPGDLMIRTVAALALERARLAAGRRKHYVGPWLPEPIVTEHHCPATNPLGSVVRAEDVRMAALRIVQQLPPEQRVALVLREVVGLPLTEIAVLLGCTEEQAEHHACRARRTVDEAHPPRRVPASHQHETVQALLAALSAEDQWAVARMLDPRVSVHGDSDGKARTALRPVHGRDRVTRFLLALIRRYATSALKNMRSVLVNGDPGLLLPGSPAGTPFDRAVAPRVVGFAVREGRAAEIHDIVNPDKLTRVRLLAATP